MRRVLARPFAPLGLSFAFAHEAEPAAPGGMLVRFARLVGRLFRGPPAASFTKLLLQQLLLLPHRSLLARQPRTFQRQVELDLPEFGLPLRFELGNPFLERFGNSARD